MQIGIRLHDTEGLVLQERLAWVKSQGFTCAHVALSKVINDFPLGAGALTPGFAMYLKKLFGVYELDIAVLGCYLNLAHPDPIEMKKILHTYMAHIRFASILGCGVVGTETGAPNVSYVFEPACHERKALETMLKNLREIVAYAEKMGVILGIEPVRNHIVYNPQVARRF